MNVKKFLYELNKNLDKILSKIKKTGNKISKMVYYIDFDNKRIDKFKKYHEYIENMEKYSKKHKIWKFIKNSNEWHRAILIKDTIKKTMNMKKEDEPFKIKNPNDATKEFLNMCKHLRDILAKQTNCNKNIKKGDHLLHIHDKFRKLAKYIMIYAEDKQIIEIVKQTREWIFVNRIFYNEMKLTVL